MEQTLGLRLTQIALRSGPAGLERPKRELSFILSTYEIKKSAPSTPSLDIFAGGTLALPSDLPPIRFSEAMWNGGRDPFQAVREASPVVYSKATDTNHMEPVYRLSGILDFGGRLRAIVNDRLVREGDSIQGDRVIAITRDSVIFLHQDKPLTVRFKPILLGGNNP